MTCVGKQALGYYAPLHYANHQTSCVIMAICIVIGVGGECNLT